MFDSRPRALPISDDSDDEDEAKAYLRAVMREAAQIPDTLVSNVKQSDFDKNRSVFIQRLPTCKPCPPGLEPKLDWQKIIIKQFEETRVEVLKAAEAVSPENRKKYSPGKNDQAGWCRIFAAKGPKSRPKLGYIISADHVFDYLLQWSREKEIDEHLASWYFSIFARLSTPIHADTAGKLRSLLYKCCEQRWNIQYGKYSIPPKEDKKNNSELGSGAVAVQTQSETSGVADSAMGFPGVSTDVSGTLKESSGAAPEVEIESASGKVDSVKIMDVDAMDIDEPPAQSAVVLEEGEIPQLGETSQNGGQVEMGELEEGEIVEDIDPRIKLQMEAAMENLPSLNILITLISHYFGQKESVST